MGQCLGLGGFSGDIGGGAGIAGIAGAAGTGAEAVGVGNQIAGAVHVAADCHGLGVVVPADHFTHELAHGADGQVGDTVVQQGIDPIAAGVVELLGHAVNDNGEVIPQGDGHGGFPGVYIGGTGGGSCGPGAGEGDGLGVVVPVHILVHQLTDGADRQIGGAAVGNGVDLLAVDGVEGAGHAVHHNGAVGHHLGVAVGDGQSRRGGGHKQGNSQGGRSQTAEDGTMLFHRSFSFSFFESFGKAFLFACPYPTAPLLKLH